jgi:hypothetical protein
MVENQGDSLKMHFNFFFVYLKYNSKRVGH